jgi:hypothetical protein
MPPRPVEQNVGSKHQAHAPIGVQLAQMLDGAERPTFAAELLFHPEHLGARKPPHRALAHREAMRERSELFRKRVPVAGHDRDLVDLFRGQHVRHGQDVRNVRRIEAATE